MPHRLLKVVTAFLAGASTTSAFSPGNNLPIARSTDHKIHNNNAATRLLAAVSHDNDDHRHLEAAWKASKLNLWNRIPHELISEHQFSEWSNWMDTQVYAKMDNDFEDMVYTIWQDLEYMVERPIMDYLQEYWDACGHSLDSEVCQEISEMIEPDVSTRLRELRRIVDTRWFAQSDILEEKEDELPAKEKQLLMDMTSVDSKMSQHHLEALLESEMARIKKEMKAVAEEQFERSSQMVDKLIVDYVQHLGESASRGKISGESYVEIEDKLAEWSWEVLMALPSWQEDRDWREEFDDVMDTAPFLDSIRKRKELDDMWNGLN